MRSDGSGGWTSLGGKQWTAFVSAGRVAVNPVRVGGAVISPNIAGAVLGFIFLYAFTVCELTFFLMASGMDFIPAFTAIIACINNAGPGLACWAGAELPGLERFPDLDLLARDACRAPRDLPRAWGALHPVFLASLKGLRGGRGAAGGNAP